MTIIYIQADIRESLQCRQPAHLHHNKARLGRGDWHYLNIFEMLHIRKVLFPIAVKFLSPAALDDGGLQSDDLLVFNLQSSSVCFTMSIARQGPSLEELMV